MPNQYTKAKETGIPHTISNETRKKMSESCSKANIERYKNPDSRKKQSEAMRKAVLNNSESYTSNNVCGRVKIEEYNGEKFHGKWELEVAKWLDSNNILWERKGIKPFNYFWNNNWHLYFPDFYLPELDMYVEVKGYERERDRCKWSVVSNLIVIKKKEMQLIKNNEFVLITH